MATARPVAMLLEHLQGIDINLQIEAGGNLEPVSHDRCNLHDPPWMTAAQDQMEPPVSGNFLDRTRGGSQDIGKVGGFGHRGQRINA